MVGDNAAPAIETGNEIEGASYKSERSDPMICFCCKEARPTVKDRKPGSQSMTRLLCDACWNDPEPAYANCKHGKG